MVIFDTDHISLLEWVANPDRSRLVHRLEQLPENQITTTVISYEEQTRGWLAYLARARTITDQVKAYSKLQRHLEIYRNIEVLNFDENAAIQFQTLRRSRLRIGTMDLKIAAIALHHEATLLSRNLGEFRKVPELRVEDWTA